MDALRASMTSRYSVGGSRRAALVAERRCQPVRSTLAASLGRMIVEQRPIVVAPSSARSVLARAAAVTAEKAAAVSSEPTEDSFDISKTLLLQGASVTIPAHQNAPRLFRSSS